MSISRTVSGSAAVAVAVLLASPSSARAFSGDNHKDLTSAAFHVLADPHTVGELRDVSVIGDSKSDEPQGPGTPWYRSGAHFDNCAWSEGSQWIKSHRTNAVNAAIAYD